MKNYATTFTVTIAAPAVFSATEHELYEDDEIELETTGALPTGLTASDNNSREKYWVIRNGITANTFQLSTSFRGDAITTTGTQSGTHTFIKLGGARVIPEPIFYE
ncbi:MAG: hypothetical protein AAB706_01555 [Patescibacteria group bacterium]